MKALPVLLVASLLATTVFAQIDPDPNSLGVYFDEAATITGFSPATFVPFNFYLVLANPTYATVGGVECTMDIVGNVAIAFNDVVYANDGISPTPPPDIFAGWSPPYPTAPVTIMATFTYTAYLADEAVLFLSASATPSIPSDNLPVIIGDGELVPVDGLSSGDPLNPVATLFWHVDPIESGSFGNVKCLFR